jgi:hypothetical protein
MCVTVKKIPHLRSPSSPPKISTTPEDSGKSEGIADITPGNEGQQQQLRRREAEPLAGVRAIPHKPPQGMNIATPPWAIKTPQAPRLQLAGISLLTQRTVAGIFFSNDPPVGRDR